MPESQPVRCDSCRKPVPDSRADYYADVLCVDWALCARCGAA